MSLNIEEAYTRRWWITGALLIGTWVGTLGNSMMPVALPSLMNQYHVGPNLAVWVISVYVLFVAVLMPIFGWLGDRYGYRRTYLFGLTGFAIFSWAAALAPNLGWLIVFRALQGICNATTLPSVMGIISGIFPGNERGGAMGVWGAVNGAAHGLAPMISGLLVEHWGWESTFWVNGGTALMGVGLIFFVVPSDRKADSRPFDWQGMAIFISAMLLLMFNLTRVRHVGGHSPLNLGLWVVFVAFMLFFIFLESRSPHPFIKLQHFANKAYSTIVSVAGTQFFCLMALQILLAMYLIRVKGLSAGFAGLLIASLAATLAVFAPVGGRTADRVGYRATLMVGMAMVTIASGSMLFWTHDTPPYRVVLTLIVVGLGMGFTQSPAAAGVTLTVPKQELGVALGIFNMLRFTGGTLGAVVVGVLLENAKGASGQLFSGIRFGFFAVTAMAGLSFVLALIIPRTRHED